MRIVGAENNEPDAVHTIDLWFSERRGGWVVERLDAEGHMIGTSHFCTNEHDATACLDHWLRAHAETHLVSPRERAKMRKAIRQPRRRAA